MNPHQPHGVTLILKKCLYGSFEPMLLISLFQPHIPLKDDGLEVVPEFLFQCLGYLSLETGKGMTASIVVKKDALGMIISYHILPEINSLRNGQICVHYAVCLGKGC